MSEILSSITKSYNKLCYIEAKQEGLYFRPNRKRSVFFFEWNKISQDEKMAFYEHFDGHSFLENLENYIPFAILGDTEESGEETTLINILDTQTDGVLLVDKQTNKLVLSDGGVLVNFADSFNGFDITENE